MSGAPETLDQTIRRLKKERDDADARYNEALTEVDRALRPPVALPDPALALDDQRSAELNQTWNIIPAPPQPASWSQKRFVGLIWRTIAPYLERQLAFNSVLVDHLNRNANAERRAHERAGEMTVALRAQLDQVEVFQARLMRLLQQVTAYVDTRDRDTAGGTLVLNSALSELAESAAKHHESFGAREHRYLARIAAIDELRTAVGVAQHAIVALKRAVDRSPLTVDRKTETAVDGSRPTVDGPRATAAFAPSLDAYKYVGFEDEFRGSQEVIRERLRSYLPYFDGAPGDVLDVGCGRGEFIDLLGAQGIPGRGIDLNHEMAEVCRARGLNVVEADAVGYLSGLPDASLGGVFAAQVVEHLEPGYLLKFLELAFVKLKPGGTLVLETLNPACWMAFFESYIRDITHKWPLHPETLRYLVAASGFASASIEFRSPVNPEDRLQPFALPVSADAVLRDVAETYNANIEKLNARMFTYMDYAIVAKTSSR